MTQETWNLPDPDTQAEFYSDVGAKRLFAFGIDSVITLAISILVLPLTAFMGLFAFPMLWLTVNFIYRFIQINGKSATWGMRIMAIELRDAQGRPLDQQTAALHTMGLCVSFFMPLLQLISVVLMATDLRGQGLTDRFLGTVVLNRRARS